MTAPSVIGLNANDNGQTPMTAREFNQIFLPMSDRLYGVAYRLLESREGAEDAVQDLFLKLWNLRDSLGGVLNPGGYAMTLLKNLCVDRIRQEELRQHQDLTESIDRPSQEPCPDAGMVEKEQFGQVLKAIDGLPSRQRQALRLRVFEEKEYSDIAEEMGISEVNVRVCLSMARKSLKTKLKTLI